MKDDTPAIGDPNDRDLQPPPAQVDDSSSTSFQEVQPGEALPLPPSPLFDALAKLEQRQEEQRAGRKEIVAADAEHVTPRLEHLADLYDALGVVWGEDPFATVKQLRERSYSDISDISQRMDDTLAELGLPLDAEDMTIARTIRSLRRRAEKLPAPQLYDSIPLFGYELVTRERIRQITQEKFGEEHDDEHTDGSMAIVAALYAVEGVDETISVLKKTSGPIIDAWPDSWDERWDKREEHDRLRQLSVAGALICAEIDRLQRLAVANEDAERAQIRERLNPRADL